MKNILIIGGRSYSESPVHRIGGTTILLDNLLEYCNVHNIHYRFISTNRYIGRFSLFLNSFAMFREFAKNVRDSSVVMLNISSCRSAMTLLPLLTILCGLFNRPLVFRMFGGSIKRYVEGKTVRKTVLLWCINHCKISFFEEKEIVEYFTYLGCDALWFPNVRKPSKYSTQLSYSKRFAFVSLIWESKGISVMEDAINMLPQDYTIDVFGPIRDPKYKGNYFKCSRLNYKGELKNGDVQKTLSEYDVLLLPSYWRGEGYPGIVIEAFSVGLPVIGTNWGGIPEIVEDRTNGFIIPIKNPVALKNAMESITTENYSTLSQNAKDSFHSCYNSEIVNEFIINKLISI